MSYKTRTMLHKGGIILLCVLVVVLVISLIAGLVKRNDDGDYNKVNVKWTVGGLNDEGAYLKKETDSLVSDHIKLREGLKVIVDFDKSVKYNIMFYDDNHIYLGAMDGGPTYSNKVLSRAEIEEIYANAEYFRITLIDIEEKDGFINIFEKGKLGNYVTVYTCNKAAELVEE